MYHASYGTGTRIRSSTVLSRWAKARPSLCSLCNGSALESRRGPAISDIDRIDFLTWTYLPSKDGTLRCADTLNFVQKRWNYHNIQSDYEVPHLPTTEVHDNLIVLYGMVLDTVRFVIDAADYVCHEQAWRVMAELLCCEEDDLRTIRIGVSKYDRDLPEAHILEPFHIFATQNGHLGLVYRTPRADQDAHQFNVSIGDVVALMLGATTPFVLRPQHDRWASYRLVAACMLGNKACGCRQGQVHDFAQLSRFVIS